jgi:outer membrane protein assembly factor BamC
MRLRGLVPAALALSLGGCGYLFGDSGLFRDSSGDYREAEERPVMRMPQGSDDASLVEIYPIPPISRDVAAIPADEVPRPAPLLSGNAAQLVRIQKLGDDSWALISMPPGQLWPQVRGFLSAANIGIARVDARTGIIESNWLDLQGQERPARFRFRVERGVQRGNSELHILQMYRGPDEEAWPSRSDNLDLEADMLRSVSQFIANSAENAPVSMMAEQSISAAGKLELVENRDGRYLRLELPFDRAWASLARALEESGFEITDRDRSAGRYYVRYADPPDDDGGWFSWFGGSDDDGHPLAGVPLLVVMDELQAGVLRIRLLPEEGAGAADESLKSLLLLVKGNLD